ncbi:uncharacterized protein B0I36DRAFT_315854 [Microdochium trichocladiopsis]|uniref:Uncharacterized protein n=1 Tax=Microdochium trichocladiopsis TaxID=1682393 RepID=A0A9P8YG09_9PEZI|nr:uncharacterized protein B0I36DRAFT_315854 [Microdochium trichocladiopsis]KAH7038242.1 hypothetical protein B0I36DRAFT_315854 [Microdochium trichocladiopsis]
MHSILKGPLKSLEAPHVSMTNLPESARHGQLLSHKHNEPSLEDARTCALCGLRHAQMRLWRVPALTVSRQQRPYSEKRAASAAEPYLGPGPTYRAFIASHDNKANDNFFGAYFSHSSSLLSFFSCFISRSQHNIWHRPLPWTFCFQTEHHLGRLFDHARIKR